jgi:hypothetical protein
MDEIIELRKGVLFDMHRREGGFKDIHCNAQNAALFVDLLINIFWETLYHIIETSFILKIKLGTKPK